MWASPTYFISIAGKKSLHPSKQILTPESLRLPYPVASRVSIFPSGLSVQSAGGNLFRVALAQFLFYFYFFIFFFIFYYLSIPCISEGLIYSFDDEELVPL